MNYDPMKHQELNAIDMAHIELLYIQDMRREHFPLVNHIKEDSSAKE